MSQEKVDRYKEEKARRKEIMKKERRKHLIRQCIICVAVLGLFGWMGYSAYTIHEDKKPRQVADVDYTAFQDYLTGIGGATAK